MINLQSISQQPIPLTITAIIDTALCVGAGGSSGSLADKPIVRTAGGQLLIPASQVKGCLRHECEKIARGLGWNVCQSPKANTMCPQRAGLSEEVEQEFQRQYRASTHNHYHCLICQMFGNPSLSSSLEFDDLVCSETKENLPEVLRPGVTINRRRQTAEEKKLYFLETSPANLKLAFSGTLQIYPEAPPQTKPLIQAALRHINALGGSKSAGLGWLSWEVESWQIDDSVWQTLLPGDAA